MTLDPAEQTALYVRRHLRFGWSELLLFLGVGILLEAMHGFKVGWYLNAGEETRRLLLTLAHAHGVLLGLVNVALAATLHAMSRPDLATLRVASPLLLAASILMPAGFLLGGLQTYGGDPGPGIFLLLPGAACLASAVSLVVWITFRSR